MVEISVIIPTYNVEKYIWECLDSAINQTFEDIEIICIDDKSTDKTPEIINEYALKDSRIRAYANDENKGIAYNRNYSLSLAKGKYIYFLDSDDYIELDALEKLYKLAEEKSLDMIMFKVIHFKNLTKREFKSVYTEMHYLEKPMKDKIFNYEDVKEFAAEICVNLPGKLFKRDLIKDIEFPNGYIFEDVPFFLEALIKAKRVYFLQEHLCHKRDRRKSIMTTYDEGYLDLMDINEFTVDAAKRHGKYEELRPYLFQFFIRTNQYMVWRLGLRMRFNFFKKMKEYYVRNKNEIDEVYDEIYLKYQAMYDSSLKSSNYIAYELRLNYLFIKNIKKVRKERKMEDLMWLEH